MRIAQVAPLFESVPPKLYGGTERVVSWLTEELVTMGHEVTLFASGDSMTSARLVPGCQRALRLSKDSIDFVPHHLSMFEQVYAQKNDFDLIHFHVDYLHFPVTRREEMAHVSTLHGRLDIPDLVPIYKAFPEMPVVSISEAQQKPLPWINWQGTVHHGLPADSLSFYPGPGKYLAFLGRTSPEKGLDEAIRISKLSGIPLKIAAKIDAADREYFTAVIKPILNDPLIEFVGEIGYAEKNEFLGNALAFLFPVNWPEPFGIVMIEALACGVPIIAYPYGSVPEVIEDSVTGFLVRDVASAVQALNRIGEIERATCRRTFEERFTTPRMAHDYLIIYEQLVNNHADARTNADSALALAAGDLNWMKLASPSSTT